ncbi:MAG: alkaline phosphatase family protein [Candidatus Tumulicola sp.]
MTRLPVLLVAACFVACSGPVSQSAVPQAPVFGSMQAANDANMAAGTTHIKYVIVMVQENRTFDNFFYGFPGANYAKTGYGHGKLYTMQPIALKWKFPLNHSHSQFLEDYDSGQNDGFDAMISGWVHGCNDYRNHPACWVYYPEKSVKQMAFSYVKQTQIQPYWTMAQQYVLGDNTFASNSGPTFPAHQYYIAGQSDHASEVPAGNPWGCDGPASNSVVKLIFGYSTPPHDFSKPTGHEVPGPFPCFTYKTIANLLDDAGVSWHYYVANPIDSSLNGFAAVKAIRYGPDWSKMETNTNIFNDIKNGALAQVSWVTPDPPDSDHPGPDTGSGGPDWVASVVNAVGESKYWNNSAIIVMWDDWGGWYDHVPPPQLADVQTHAYEGLGFRIPLIIVSPYAKPHHVTHQLNELASSMTFIEKIFGLPSLGQADARANAFEDAFDFRQKPTPFTPIPTHLKAQYFIHHQVAGQVDEQ